MIQWLLRRYNASGSGEFEHDGIEPMKFIGKRRNALLGRILGWLVRS